MGLIKEFKEFSIKGNMVDMAVGIIIGTAFNNVVQTLVKTIIMPPLSMMTDGINYAEKKLILRDAGMGADGNEVTEVAIGWGEMIEVFIDFLVIGIVMFIVVKVMNRWRNKAQDPENKAVSTPKDIELLNDLRELMEEQNRILKNRNA